MAHLGTGGWSSSRSLPGERVLARITDEAKAFVRADAVEILEASPSRVRRRAATQAQVAAAAVTGSIARRLRGSSRQT